MASPHKRQKIQEESTHHVWLRLCDPFIRTDGNLICPIIKAETSIRVLFRLQVEVLKEILKAVFSETGIKTQIMRLSKSSPDRDLQGNLFIQCVSPNIINEEKLSHFKERLIFHLSNHTRVKYVSVDQVDSTEAVIPQPMISEPDFEMHKLELCYKALSEIKPDKTDAVSFIKDSIAKLLEEFKEKHTKIALLSQNGKGKSFLLNLLFLLTIDNEEEYQNNNKNLKLPKDVTGDPTVKELGETINHLPDVVKDFLKTYKNTEEKFQTLMESVCFELKPVLNHGTDQSKNLFSSLPKYFKDRGRVKTEPYILAQKDLEHSYESTTKCIIHLRYGTVYQIKVDYFSSEDLKQQLFELVLFNRNHTTNLDKKKDKEYKCLQSRFAILTDSNISGINKNSLQNFNKYSDIVLCKEVEQFAGETQLYLGSGRNSTEDRLALKAFLKGLTSPQSSDKRKWKYRVAALKKIVVYLPSKILYGGKEILEMPGTDDSDALALDFINKGLSMVDALCVMSDYAFKIAETEVKDALIHSDFLQNWKKNPELVTLMFLTYPEKDTIFQFSSEERKQIEILKNKEVERRSTDLEQLCELIGMRSLPQNMDAAVFTSYILPVLHTSIHAQEGAPHQVIQEHACFLKFTGIKKLITHLDTFVSSLRKTDFQQLQETLTTKTTKDILAEHARVFMQMYETRALKAIRVNELFRQYDNLIINLRKSLTTVYGGIIDRLVVDAIPEMKKESLKTWDLNKKDITSISVFNPYFAGNHSKYKVKISRIILNDIENLKSKIVASLKEEIFELLKKFENDVIDLFAKELDTVLKIGGYENIESKTFVQQSIQDVLSEAQKWYIGRQNQPINERTIGKCLKESKQDVLKKFILRHAYDQRTLKLAKQVARQNIAGAVMAVKKELKTRLLELHVTRWGSFCCHLRGRNNIPKPWQVLLGKLKKFYQSANTQQQQPDELSAVLKLITANNPK